MGFRKELRTLWMSFIWERVAAMRNIAIFVILAFVSGAAFCDEPPPLVNGGGAGLKDLVGSGKLVSVVLKDRGAVDQNLEVVEVGPDYVAVSSPTHERTSYRFSAVQEVRVQDGKVEAKKFTVDESRSLKIEEQKVVDRAFDRAREIFEAANSEQGLKMRAASLIALTGKKEADEYLRRLAASNDLETEIDATLRLYLAGDKDLAGPLVAQGLQSGNRKIKAKSAKLAGLVNDQNAIPLLMTTVQDRIADICAPAARALGRLKCKEAIPFLMKMLPELTQDKGDTFQTIHRVGKKAMVELNEDKGDAASFALTLLGQSDPAVKASIVEQLKDKLKTTSGQSQYRIVTVLFSVGDPQGKELLVQQFNQYPTLQPDAALLLARDGNWDAIQYLNSRLKRRYDEDEDVMRYRAMAAAALIQGSDATAVSYLQDLLRSDKVQMKKTICALIAELGKRKLIPVIQAAVENSNPDLAIQACTAVVAIAKPDFRARFVAFLN